jgi:hypothetical protein
MTPDWLRIYKTLDAMRYDIRRRVRMLYGEGHSDEARLVNSLCTEVWHAAARYAVQYEVFVNGVMEVDAGDDGAERHRPPETTSPRVAEMEQRLKDVLGDLLEEGETVAGEDENTEEDPWSRPDDYAQWVLVEFAEAIRGVSGLVDQLLEAEDAKIGGKHVSHILAKHSFEGLMRRIWKRIRQKEGWRRVSKSGR